jgi:uncharacterized protein HemX
MMANREKGEISIEIGGKPYTLVLNTNALVELQDVLSTPKALATIDEIYARVNQGSLRHVRAMVWAALRKYHSDLTLESVGELIDAAGGFVGMNALLESVQQASAPEAADVAELRQGVNPPKARAAKKKRGTGDVFTSMRAKSA